MILFLYHGRTRPEGPATDVDGNQVDNWGFEGPAINDIKYVDFTYGCLSICFDTAEHFQLAQRTTGWRNGNSDWSLTLDFSPSDGLVMTWNTERQRSEYFGDFILE